MCLDMRRAPLDGKPVDAGIARKASGRPRSWDFAAVAACATSATFAASGHAQCWNAGEERAMSAECLPCHKVQLRGCHRVTPAADLDGRPQGATPQVAVKAVWARRWQSRWWLARRAELSLYGGAVACALYGGRRRPPPAASLVMPAALERPNMTKKVRLLEG